MKGRALVKGLFSSALDLLNMRDASDSARTVLEITLINPSGQTCPPACFRSRPVHYASRASSSIVGARSFRGLVASRHGVGLDLRQLVLAPTLLRFRTTSCLWNWLGRKPSGVPPRTALTIETVDGFSRVAGCHAVEDPIAPRGRRWRRSGNRAVPPCDRLQQRVPPNL